MSLIRDVRKLRLKGWHYTFTPRNIILKMYVSGKIKRLIKSSAKRQKNTGMIRTTSSACITELMKWIFTKKQGFLEPPREGLISYFLDVTDILVNTQ